MHLTGLLGMPRRVHTYAAGLGWDALNMISTVGAFVLAAGIAARAGRPRAAPARRRARSTRTCGMRARSNGCRCDDYAARSIPRIASRDPLWDQPGLAREVDAGRHYLPGTATGGRETIVTSPVDARPQYVLLLPGRAGCRSSPAPGRRRSSCCSP